MHYDEQKPLITQSDGTILVETDHQEFQIVQAILVNIADLQQCPKGIHTYKMTPLSIWNAAELGITASEIISFLSSYSKFPVPEKIRHRIQEYFDRHGAVQLIRNEMGKLQIMSTSKDIVKKLTTSDYAHFFERLSESSLLVKEEARGILKQLCLSFDYPVHDLAGFEQGNDLEVSLQQNCTLRPYQKEAVAAFYQKGKNDGGSGVIVLPCGSGKTVVGIGVLTTVKEEVLILTPNETSMMQWKRELLAKTSLSEDLIGLYQSKTKEVKPVTIATYQMLTYRNKKTKEFQHLPLFNRRNWGLIIYDEVHLLPAPLFRTTAGIQGKRRLGLTATLVREDGNADDVFSLIGPKRYEAPWKALENNGWIATAICKEIKVEFTDNDLKTYFSSKSQEQYRIAAENERKIDVISRILSKHENQPTLIIGQYVEQLEKVAQTLHLPIITGSTPKGKREYYYELFKNGEITILVVSKIANLAVDLPNAEVAIQISGAFGSRQEEAQRIGRLLRPLSENHKAIFYSIITKGSKEETFSENRQRFMVEQGYEYELEEWLE
ncbi:DNA repair helicase XPB [Anaerobacillus sp. MEB173]|uniref:DNA repair helicase XPB n=1 Tax=Anaerobacillus sp. MEB173 TaxID=3383345 RepID=UPI003F936AA2